jgi:hypothetical protein
MHTAEARHGIMGLHFVGSLRQDILNKRPHKYLMIYQHILHKSNNVVLNHGCTKYCKDQKKSPQVSNKAEKCPERTDYRNRKVNCWFD